MAAIAGIGMKPLGGVANELLDGRNDPGQGVAIIGIAWQRLGVDGELAALAVLERGRSSGGATHRFGVEWRHRI